MKSPKAAARLAGVLYVLAGATGVFSYLYLPGAFIAPGDATETARRITDGALTYRLGIASDLASSIFLLLLALSLYELLKDHDRRYARLMVSLVAVAVAVAVVNVLKFIAPLILLSGADFLSAFSKPQQDALALVFLKLRSSGLALAQVFWGLWLFPFGLLVIKSALFPKILGVLLISACLAYVAQSLTFLVLPAYVHVVALVTQPIEGLGEGLMILWLLIKGTREPAAAT